MRTWTLGLLLLVAACGDDTSSSGSVGGEGVGASPNGGSGGLGGSGATGGGGGSAGAPTGGSGGVGGAGGSGGAGGTGGSGGAGGSGGTGGGCQMTLPVPTEIPERLSETGLYSDLETLTIAPEIREFAPRYPLWSDGETKRRWVYLPDCGVPIDNTDMDNWQVPVGTRFWKEFVRDGVRVETRFFVRTGPSTADFVFATYLWMPDGDAMMVMDGEMNVMGTQHDVPPVALCSSCHRRDWRVLGFSAFQLTHDGPGETITTLSDSNWLSTPAPLGFEIPGDDIEKAGLGTLHANCGNCHFDGGVPNPALRLKVLTANATPEETPTYQTAVNVPTTLYQCSGCDRIEPGDSAASAVVQRMGSRGASSQMPPIATEIVDTEGLAAVSTWIDAMIP